MSHAFARTPAMPVSHVAFALSLMTMAAMSPPWLLAAPSLSGGAAALTRPACPARGPAPGDQRGGVHARRLGRSPVRSRVGQRRCRAGHHHECDRQDDQAGYAAEPRRLRAFPAYHGSHFASPVTASLAVLRMPGRATAGSHLADTAGVGFPTPLPWAPVIAAGPDRG